jgi:hypothetical protein
VVQSTAHANNQHYQEQYTDQANQDRPNPRPTYPPEPGCMVPHPRADGEEPEIATSMIGHGSNPNSYKVRKVRRACKQQTMVNIDNLKPWVAPDPTRRQDDPPPRATRFTVTPEYMSDMDKTDLDHYSSTNEDSNRKEEEFKPQKEAPTH